MFASALITFSTSLALFFVLAIFVQIEHACGRRFVAVQFRNWLDIKVVRASKVWHESVNHFMRYIVQLGWYYSIHSLLRTILRVLVSMYAYIEDIFERNRTRTKQLRLERKKRTKQTHLTQIADHRIETALSPDQQKQLRKKKLEHDH